jgi:hypothetical protein
MKYIYDSHLGGIYVSDSLMNHEELYCEQCGDSDQLLGTFETLKEFWNVIKDDCSIDGSGGYSLQHVFTIIFSEFDYPFHICFDSYYDAEDGFCSNTDADIIEQIENFINT